MLEKSMRYIESGEKKYPVICTMNTLEYIQNHYTTIPHFQRLVSGIVEKEGKEKKYTPINVAAMMDGFTAMLNEGIDVHNWKLKEKEPMEHVTRQQASVVLREAGISLVDASLLVQEELAECILGKNVQTAQRKTKVKRKRRLTLRGFCTLRRLFLDFRKRKQGACSSGNI